MLPAISYRPIPGGECVDTRPVSPVYPRLSGPTCRCLFDSLVPSESVVLRFHASPASTRGPSRLDARRPLRPPQRGWLTQAALAARLSSTLTATTREVPR